MLRKLTAPQKPSFLPCNDLKQMKKQQQQQSENNIVKVITNIKYTNKP